MGFEYQNAVRVQEFWPTPIKSGALDIEDAKVGTEHNRCWGILKEHRELIERSVKRNRISRIPIGACVYFPKHVVFPRSRFRHFGIDYDARIVQKLGLATVMVVDPFFLYQMFMSHNSHFSADHPWESVLEVRHPHKLEKHFISHRAWEVLNLEFHPYLVRDEWQRISGDTKTALVAMDHLVQCLVERPELKIITYDRLNYLVNRQELDEIDELLKTIQMIRTAGAGHVVKMGLNWIATLNPKKYEFVIWATVNLIRHFSDQREHYKSNLHDNIMRRNIFKMAKVYFGNARYWEAVSSSILNVRIKATPVEELLESSVTDLLKMLLIHNGTKKAPKSPEWFGEWWVRRRLDKYMDTFSGNVFLSAYKNKPTSWKIEKLLHHFLKTTSTTNLNRIGVVSETLGFDLVVLLQYLIENYEQEKPEGGPRLGTELCSTVVSRLPDDSDQP